MLLTSTGVDSFRAAASQRQYLRTLHEATNETTAQSPAHPPALGTPIGRLEIPRLGVSGAVVHGDNDDLLKGAIGHLPDTPLPWLGGNSALAAHRDTLFRRLRDVRSNDVVRLTTPYGNFDYRVRETLIVDPEDLWVLDPTPTTTLTLITCYPFNYVGSAPRRFIVRAESITRPDRAPVGRVGGVDPGSMRHGTKDR